MYHHIVFSLISNDAGLRRVSLAVHDVHLDDGAVPVCPVVHVSESGGVPIVHKGMLPAQDCSIGDLMLAKSATGKQLVCHTGFLQVLN